MQQQTRLTNKPTALIVNESQYRTMFCKKHLSTMVKLGEDYNRIHHYPLCPRHHLHYKNLIYSVRMPCRATFAAARSTFFKLSNIDIVIIYTMSSKISQIFYKLFQVGKLFGLVNYEWVLIFIGCVSFLALSLTSFTGKSNIVLYAEVCVKVRYFYRKKFTKCSLFIRDYHVTIDSKEKAVRENT
uniref:Ion_trans domain-containing protein n=1 Tax=Angiostrongylus cantonensis TaxID=6313 RepID=A0A0K0DCE2_ANGCA